MQNKKLLQKSNQEVPGNQRSLGKMKTPEL